MFFKIVNTHSSIPRNALSQVFLIWDDWNDYSYFTAYGILYVDAKGQHINLGGTKIGFYGQQERERKLKIGDNFDQIYEDHFSVGYNDDYYDGLNKLDANIRDKILFGLNDIAKIPSILERVVYEDVFKISFLRGLSLQTIEGQFTRMAMGGARLTPFHFNFVTPSNITNKSITISFNVYPLSLPPTNIHVLIGRNGAGKTSMINNMINCLMEKGPKNELGSFIFEKDNTEEIERFSNLVCITFSAFDEFEHPIEQKDKSLGINYSYIGLKSVQDDGATNDLIDLSTLTNEFIKSISNCKTTFRTSRWKEAILTLYSDPNFKYENIAELIEIKNVDELNSAAKDLFKKLSSGHKIVLLTITRLVEKLEERSLVLIDEPESHLHPPLLSSFMRALSELMIDRNAVSIIATHSPVILQEVPKSCVWKLRRVDTELTAERLQIESFGENVGVLTQEVFGLEVTDSGFHKILKHLVNSNHTYDSALKAMDYQIGLEARAILRGLFFQKEKRK
jgi:ABC-type branched-subunit amino acid transport system ATPase component